MPDTNWTLISGSTPQDYTDTAVFEVNPDTKQIALITGQALVAGEKDSQYISFIMPRYWDGIDIADKTFTVEYALAGTYYGTSEAVNAEMTTEQVRIGWIVPETACAISGTLLFILKITSEDYVLKTQIAEHPVFKTINVEDVVPEPTKEAWYREFQTRVDSAIEQAESAIETVQSTLTDVEAAAQLAQTAALNAQIAEENAETAAATAQTRYGSPLTAAEADEMIEQNRVYVYVGSETGYTNGHWYYYNGSEWADGGVYNGTGINTDTTLTQAGMAADAKATGDEISQIKENFTNIGVFGESPYNHGPYCTKKVDFAQYYEGRNESYGITLNQNTQYQDVIDLFDDLVSADPTHITKTALGTASGGQTIYEYAFAPYTYTGSLGSDTTLKKNPLILMDAGIHGFEKNSVYGLYFFLDDLVNNWQADPILTAIRQNVEIRVIPVSNPDAFNRDRYYNANGVNVNRNFACTGWTPISGSATNNSGAEPFDQPESAILRDWVESFPNIMLYLNLHTNGAYNVTAYSDVNSCMPKFDYTNGDGYFGKIAEVVRRHIQMQSGKIPQMYDTVQATYGKYQQTTGSIGTMAVWLAETAKVVGMTFELFNGVKVDGTQIIGYYSADSKKMCSEIIGNMIAQTLVEYSEV